MLKLKPNCEQCGKDLGPAAEDARICSFECTFCADCVATVLFNVCPNCGGGLMPRPARPKAKLATSPASVEQVFKPLDPDRHRAFSETLKTIPQAER